MQILNKTAFIFAAILLAVAVESSPTDGNPLYQNATELATGVTPIYHIDCDSFPNVCENWCYYVHCKKGSWDVHVDRKANLRPQSDCHAYNRCSSGRKSGDPDNGWSVNPNKGWSCDEQPKNTNSEGGKLAATRCMPAGENSGEGSKWGAFVDGKGDAGKVHGHQADGALVTVKLDNEVTTGFCGGNKKCVPPATPPGTNVAADGARQM